MNRIYLSALPLFFLASCNSSAPQVVAQVPVTYAAYPLKQSEIADIKSKTAAKLKDPDSAKFGRISAVKSGTIVEVCGMLNAKNSYGGYTGTKPFYGAWDLSQGIYVPIAVGGSDAEVSASYTICRKLGIAMME